MELKWQWSVLSSDLWNTSGLKETCLQFTASHCIILKCLKWIRWSGLNMSSYRANGKKKKNSKWPNYTPCLSWETDLPATYSSHWNVLVIVRKCGNKYGSLWELYCCDGSGCNKLRPRDEVDSFLKDSPGQNQRLCGEEERQAHWGREGIRRCSASPSVTLPLSNPVTVGKKNVGGRVKLVKKTLFLIFSKKSGHLPEVLGGGGGRWGWEGGKVGNRSTSRSQKV